MDAKKLSVTEVVRNFSDYINRVAYRQEAFVLCRGRRPIAELRPVPVGRRLGDLPSLLASLPHLTERETKAFAKDLNAARQTLSEEEMRDPWAS